MSKITFRADDDLVERLEALDASKSEVMRDALRAHLDGAERGAGGASDEAGDALVDTIDALIAKRLDRARPANGRRRDPARDINLNVSIDGAGAVERGADVGPAGGRDSERKTDPSAAAESEESRCEQCGETMDGSHVYCPNCGEKSSHRVFCECGDELRSDWAFCPSCGRRTPAADVLDRP